MTTEQYIQKHSGSFAPCKSGRYEVCKSGNFQQRYATSKEAKAFIASCLRDNEGLISEYSICDSRKRA